MKNLSENSYSIDFPPIFHDFSYDHWRIRIKFYIQSIYFEL